MNDKKTYYWIKLQSNFFNSLEIKTILKKEKGAEYVIFWQKLLLEVIDKIDSGVIRYKESIPYTPDVLSTITDTDIDTVKGAMSLFIKMNMIEILENGNLIIDEVIQEMVGRISDEGLRKREYREKIAEIKQLGQCPIVSKNVPTILEKEKEKEKEKEIQKEELTSRFTPPSEYEVAQYITELKNSGKAVDFTAEYFINNNTARGWMIGKNKMKDWRAAVRTWVINGQKFKTGKISTTKDYSVNADEFNDMYGGIK